MSKKLTINEIRVLLEERVDDDRFRNLRDIPHPKVFKDMEKATKRIVEAINNHETINLVGDYDVDGIVSTAIMVEFFKFLEVELNYIIPNRFEHGYGLSPKIVEQIEQGLIITVDNGISAFEAAEICKQRGLDLIITDHHTVAQNLPVAYAVVNPKQNDCNYPFQEICGATVAWYLCASIKSALGVKYDMSSLFDLLCLAVVADIMPMISLNQTLVRHGLKSLEKSKRAAFVAIKDRFCTNSFNEDDIGFKIAPLINCAGRMGDPMVALSFLLSESIDEANSSLDYLMELNEQRKEEQLTIFNESKEKVNPDDEVIVVYSDSWNEGIIGIVASKLCEKYKKPAFVFSIDEDKAKASCRSTSSVHLYNLIDSCKEYLLGFGGHKQAAGLSCEAKNIEDFKKALNKNIKSFKEIDTQGNNSIFGELDLSLVNGDVYNLIENFRPFGLENPYPVFKFSNLYVLKSMK